MHIEAIEKALDSIYKSLGVEEDAHFVLTSSGAEAISHVLFASYGDLTRKTGKNHFLYGSLNEMAVILAMKRLKDLGCLSQMIPAHPTGHIAACDVAEHFSPRTALLSLTAAHRLTAVIQPLEEISHLCQERGILLHVEATMLVGREDDFFQKSGASFLSFNGPRAGLGGLFIKKDTFVSPLIFGDQRADPYRGGSYNVAALLELADWAEQERRQRDMLSMEGARMRALFEEAILQIPATRVLFSEQERLPHVTTLLFPRIVGETLGMLLRQKNIPCCWGGGAEQPLYHILKACGFQAPECYGALSFSFSAETDQEEIERRVALIRQLVARLQRYGQHFFEAAL